MRYKIEFSQKARDQIRVLPKELRSNLGWRLESLRDDLHGDVTKLKAQAIDIGCESAPIEYSSCWQAISSKCMVSKIEKKLMSDAAVLEKIEKLAATVMRLEERVEDLEDLRDLEQAIAEKGDKPLISWDQAKAELELD